MNNAAAPKGPAFRFFNYHVTLFGHGFETDRPVRTFQAESPLSGARSANIDKSMLKKSKVTLSHNKMTNVILASGRGVPSTKSRIVKPPPPPQRRLEKRFRHQTDSSGEGAAPPLAYQHIAPR